MVRAALVIDPRLNELQMQVGWSCCSPCPALGLFQFLLGRFIPLVCCRCRRLAGLGDDHGYFPGRRIDLDAVDCGAGFLGGAQGARQLALVERLAVRRDMRGRSPSTGQSLWLCQRELRCGQGRAIYSTGLIFAITAA